MFSVVGICPPITASELHVAQVEALGINVVLVVLDDVDEGNVTLGWIIRLFRFEYIAGVGREAGTAEGAATAKLKLKIATIATFQEKETMTEGQKYN